MKKQPKSNEKLRKTFRKALELFYRPLKKNRITSGSFKEKKKERERGGSRLMHRPECYVNDMVCMKPRSLTIRIKKLNNLRCLNSWKI